MVKMDRDKSLVSRFVESAREYANRPALFVDGEAISYRALGKLANQISATLDIDENDTRLAAVFAHRSLSAYAGVLGTLLSGRGYVPLNPKFPITRTCKMLNQSDCNLLVVGRECLTGLKELLSHVERTLTLVLPEAESAEIANLREQFSLHRFIAAEQLAEAVVEPTEPEAVDSDDIAYLLFTSGSTGDPKGVGVTHANATAYIDYTISRYGVGPEDRLSQTFDLTFDLSVHDMFVSWGSGACLYSIPEVMATAPAKFVRDNSLTLWFSVPSVVGYMSRLRLLRPGVFPSLRYSLFCGEALPGKFAMAWQETAPNSIVENLYGPTEATIAITNYRWDPASSAERWADDVTPIGHAFEGQHTCIVNDKLEKLPPEQAGELLLGGSQLTPGYWRDPDKTAERFVFLADGERWYRTGDLAMENEDGCLVYQGRIDDQVKIRGYRVELQEIDLALHKLCPAAEVAAIAWPVSDGFADGVVAFIAGDAGHDLDQLLTDCRSVLPEYMVPREIRCVDSLPRNANGKIDRRQLAVSLEEEME